MLWPEAGPARGNVTGGWRKFNNEEVHDLYGSSNIIYAIRIAYKIVVAK
jgi:hypothetical protein